MLAMTATRLGKIDLAVDTLLRDEKKNQYSPVGHTPQIGLILPLYLPSTGAFLAALSLLVMGDPRGKTGNLQDHWHIRAEGFMPWP